MEFLWPDVFKTEAQQVSYFQQEQEPMALLWIQGGNSKSLDMPILRLFLGNRSYV